MEYSAEDIKILRGLSSIRKRPQIYFKETGREICIHLLHEVVTSIADPAYKCGASYINIKTLCKGGIRIKYDGIGMPITSVIKDGISHPILYLSIMRLSHNKNGEYDFAKYGHLREIGAYLAAMSKELTIVTQSEKKFYSASFEFGAINSLLLEVEIYNSNELYIIFAPELLDGSDINSIEVNDLINWASETYPSVEVDES